MQAQSTNPRPMLMVEKTVPKGSLSLSSTVKVLDVIKADFAEAGDEDVYRKLYEDLKNKNISEDQIRKKMQECNEKATTEVS